jgi:hypothetical protein
MDPSGDAEGRGAGDAERVSRRGRGQVAEKKLGLLSLVSRVDEGVSAPL